MNKYYKIYVREFFEKQLEEIFEQERESAWFKDLYFPSQQAQIYAALQSLMKKRYAEFVESLAEHEHLSAVNLEIDLPFLRQFEEKADAFGGLIFEVLNDQLELLPGYIRPLMNDYTYFLIPNLEKTVGFENLHAVFKGEQMFENLHFNYPKRMKNFERDFILTWREKVSPEIIRQILSKAGFEKSVLNLPFPSKKIFVKIFNSKEEAAFHFFNISKISSQICSAFGVNFADFLNKIEDLEKTVQFNLTILLLFKVFNFNYFSASVYWNDLRLGQKEGVIILHSNFSLPVDFDPSREFEENGLSESRAFLDWQEKMATTLENMKVFGQAGLLEEKYESALRKELSDCKEDIWGCKWCEKLFESQEFLIKHSKQKHSNRCEKIREVIEEDFAIENFFEDKFNRLLVNFDSVFLKFSLGKRKGGPLGEEQRGLKELQNRAQMRKSTLSNYLNI